MLWALGGRPRLVVPEGLWGRLGPSQRDAVLLHELAHLRRCDHRVRLLELVVETLYGQHQQLLRGGVSPGGRPTRRQDRPGRVGVRPGPVRAGRWGWSDSTRMGASIPPSATAGSSTPMSGSTLRSPTRTGRRGASTSRRSTSSPGWRSSRTARSWSGRRRATPPPAGPTSPRSGSTRTAARMRRSATGARSARRSRRRSRRRSGTRPRRSRPRPEGWRSGRTARSPWSGRTPTPTTPASRRTGPSPSITPGASSTGRSTAGRR